MQNKINLRQAERKDIPFVTRAIMESEKSGTDRLSYVRIFSLTENKVKDIIAHILEENIPGQQYCFSNFIIAEIEDNYAGACCSWIEGEEGVSSSIIMASLLLDFIDHNNYEEAKSRLQIATEIGFQREPGSIQIENVFVEPEYRGRGISSQMIELHIRYHKTKSNAKKVQIILSKTNENAFKSYQKSGFRITAEKSSNKEEILNILPSNTNIMMERELI